MLVQRGRFSTQDTVTGLFALYSILGYPNKTILTTLNLHVASIPPIKFELYLVCALGDVL